MIVSLIKTIVHLILSPSLFLNKLEERFITESLKLLGGDFSSNVLVFVTDGARYMLKAGKALQVLFPKLIHITCLAHGLNLVAETVQGHYPKVDRLISKGKIFFRKCPSRTLTFREMAKGIPLPPRPAVTRWGNYRIKYFK